MLVSTWSGIILVLVPLLLRRACLYFAVDTVVSSQDVIEGFDAAGLDVDDINSIQRKNSNNTWVVSFNSADCKERALALPSLQIAGCTAVLGDSENTTVIVKIYEAPDEMPHTMIISRLSAYGTVLSFRRDKISSTISNGIPTVRVRLKKPIPSAAYIAGEVVYFFYASQPRTCRRCGLEGHMARSCSAVWCYSCEKPGHHSSECNEPPRCSVCLESSHDLAGYPFVFYSANVVPPAPGAATYAKIIDRRSADLRDPPLGANRPSGLGNPFQRGSHRRRRVRLPLRRSPLRERWISPPRKRKSSHPRRRR